MKRAARHPRRLIYLTACLTALGIYTCQRLEVPLPNWINNYVNDLLCLPLVLGCLTQLVRWLKKDADFHFPFVFHLALATYYSWFFEVWLPEISARYTADWFDVLLYFFGAVCYYGISRKRYFPNRRGREISSVPS